MISPVAIGTTATRLPAGNPSRANHCPCSLIFGNVFCRKESPAISIFKLRAFICYPLFGRAARYNGLPLVSCPFQLAWHGHFVFALEKAFRFHAGIIPKQFRFSRKIFKNLFADSKRPPVASGQAAVLDSAKMAAIKIRIILRGSVSVQDTPVQKHGKATAMRPHMRRKRIRHPCEMPGRLPADSFCMLFVCFLSIVLEKSAKVRKRTKAHTAKNRETHLPS